jgi:hypothetical protein
MEAWIVHIREEWITDQKLIGDEKITTMADNNKYSVWATEQQALKNAAEYLKDEALDSWSPVFYKKIELREAMISLIDSNKISSAISLVNKYTTTYPIEQNPKPRKVNIVINQSKFLGSPFE